MTMDNVGVEFVSASGRTSVRGQLDGILHYGRIVQCAVAFFTEAGLKFMAGHAKALGAKESFYVASVSYPTDIDALHSLHKLAPGHVYIHLGGALPTEMGLVQERALMHSKVFLASAGEQARLWVGSHNLTAMALEGGNYEAGVEVRAYCSDAVVQTAHSHLVACRDASEVFDPSRIEAYKALQRGGGGGGGDAMRILVIHAEKDLDRDPTFPSQIECRVPDEGYDQEIRPDYFAHLYLYPKGSITRGMRIDTGCATAYHGRVTALNFTEHNRRNKGIAARLDAARFVLDIVNVPLLRRPADSEVRPHTQAVLRIDGPLTGAPGIIYSLTARPKISFVAAVDPSQDELSSFSPDMRRYFTQESVAQDRLHYRPIHGVRRLVEVTAYEATANRNLGGVNCMDMPAVATEFRYIHPASQSVTEECFFVSKYQFRLE